MVERPTHYMPVEALGMTEEMAEGIETATKTQKDWKHFTPDFVDTHQQTVNITDLLGNMKQSAEIFNEHRITQPEARIRIKSDLPISIVFMGDLHIGSVYANMDEIERKFETIKKTPNTYVIFMSNLIDNAIPAQFPDSMLANSIPPDQQVYLMRHYAEDLNKKGKILAAVTSPCHEGWTWKKAGQDINALLFGFKGRKFPVLENGGRVHIKMPGVEYMGAIYHQVGPYESNFNETHALRQLNRLQLGMNADFVAGGHKHVGAAQTVFEDTGLHRKTVAYIRTGSEKGTGAINDQWSVGRYGSTGEPSGQVLHLFPFKRQLDCQVDFDTGILAHEGYYIKAMIDKEK